MADQRFDWKAFEKIFGERHPMFQPEQLKQMMNDPEWIQQYVQDMLNKAMPNNNWMESMSGGWISGSGSGGRQTQVFETHRSVIARFQLPAGARAYDMRLYAEPLRFRVEGLPNGRSVEVRLPALVRSQAAKAQIKDGVLEVRAPKDSASGREKEIPIDPL